MKPLKVGVLGGTFDPVHNGHVFVAEYVLQELGLDRVYLVTAKSPPHKSHFIADAEFRHAMVEEAIKGKPRLLASRLELDREGKSYTVDTFRQLKEELPPGTELYMITSVEYLRPEPAESELAPADCLGKPADRHLHWLGNWEGVDELFRLCRIVVTPRRHMDAALAREWAALLPAADIIVVDLPSPPVSSLMVKRHLQRGMPIHALVPPAVEAWIKRTGLYTADGSSADLAHLEQFAPSTETYSTERTLSPTSN